jgi:hypothetical protein
LPSRSRISSPGMGTVAFSAIDTPPRYPVRDRAGWLREQEGSEFEVLFTSEGLREATKGFDFKRALDVLQALGALAAPLPSAKGERASPGEDRRSRTQAVRHRPGSPRPRRRAPAPRAAPAAGMVMMPTRDLRPIPTAPRPRETCETSAVALPLHTARHCGCWKKRRKRLKRHKNKAGTGIRLVSPVTDRSSASYKQLTMPKKHHPALL